MTLRVAAIAAAMLLFAGCYFDRLTGNYEDSLSSNVLRWDDAVIETSGFDQDSEIRRTERLMALNKQTEDEYEYRINPGDKIEVRVYGHDDIGVTTTVSPDGRIGLVFIGQLKVSGLTIAEASAAIERGLAPYVKHPVAGVTILEVSNETITMAGACARPGPYNISSDTRLADAYALAGGSADRLFNGVEVDIADLSHSVIVRDGEILPVNFREAIDNGDPLNNIRLRKGDYIHIAQRMESSITICGDVASPHRRLYEEGAGLIETLATAGWLEETHWSHVIIIRDSLANPKMYKIDVDGILAGKHRNVKLMPNDIIYVPKDNLSEFNVFVRKLMPTAQLFNLISTDKLSSQNGQSMRFGK